MISPLLALGARGGVLASAHLATRSFVALHEAWRDGDVARARPLGHRLAALSAALFAEPNPAVVKALLHAQGRIATPAARPPRPPPPWNAPQPRYPPKPHLGRSTSLGQPEMSGYRYLPSRS